jgi:hypothetical protein
MDETSRDTLFRLAAFDHVRRLAEVHDHLTSTELKPGFAFDGERGGGVSCHPFSPNTRESGSR